MSRDVHVQNVLMDVGESVKKRSEMPVPEVRKEAVCIWLNKTN